MPENRHAEPLVPETEDNQSICFEQGKPCVYEPDDEPGTVVTEWPNGVTDRWWLETDTLTRYWPDGTSEDTPGDKPLAYPDPRLAEPPENNPVPQLIIVIGANGAGKTTWCRRHGDLLPDHFYNHPPFELAHAGAFQQVQAAILSDLQIDVVALPVVSPACAEHRTTADRVTVHTDLRQAFPHGVADFEPESTSWSREHQLPLLSPPQSSSGGVLNLSSLRAQRHSLNPARCSAATSSRIV